MAAAESRTAAASPRLSRAKARLPRHLPREALIRADTADGAHEFLTWLTARSDLVRRHDPQLADGGVAWAADHVGDAVGDVLGG